MMRVYTVLPDRLFVSARTHGLTSEERQTVIRQYRINAVVNLWHTADPEMRGRVVAHLHYPLPDGSSVDSTRVLLIAGHVTRLLRRGFRVLVHCYGGRNRSGLIAALTLREWLGISGAEALRQVQTQRPKSLVNAAFADFLRSLPRP